MSTSQMTSQQSTSQNVSSKNQYIIGAVLLALMVITRGNISAHLQDASWAIFFLVGFYLRDSSLVRLGFPVFFLAAFAIDLTVIDAQGGVHYCFTPAYPFLIPAYASMWFAGKWLGKTHAENNQENVRGLFRLVASAAIGVTVCFLISNAGFYFFSEKFEAMSASQYASSVAQYLPAYLKTTALYLGFAAVVHMVVVQSNKLSGERAHS